MCQEQPSMATKDLIDTVRVLIEENRHITIAEAERYFQDLACNLLSHRIVINIIRVRLDMRKIYARWVPKLLDDEDKWNQVATGLDFIPPYYTKGDDLFDQIVTRDENGSIISHLRRTVHRSSG